MIGPVMTRVGELWVGCFAPVVGLGLVIWLGVITGWPDWSISLVSLAAFVVFGYVALGRRRDGRPPWLGAAMSLVVVLAAAGTLVAGIDHLRADRALIAERDRLRLISGDLVCTMLTTGTDADRSAARAAATGDLAARLRSGAAPSGSPPAPPNGSVAQTATRCTPARTGLGAVTADTADVVVAANLRERVGSEESATGHVVAARLERVRGTWKVAALDLIR